MEIDPILEKWDRRLNPKNYPQAEGSRAATFTPDSRALSQEIEAQKKRANAHVFGEYENMKLRIQDAQAAPIELPPTAGRRGSKDRGSASISLRGNHFKSAGFEFLFPARGCLIATPRGLNMPTHHGCPGHHLNEYCPNVWKAGLRAATSPKVAIASLRILA